MISKTFELELNSIFKQNSSNRLYEAQFQLLVDRLKEEYSLLNAEKMSLYRNSADPKSSPKLKQVECRISENRAEIMKLYKTTVRKARLTEGLQPRLSHKCGQFEKQEGQFKSGLAKGRTDRRGDWRK